MDSTWAGGGTVALHQTTKQVVLALGLCVVGVFIFVGAFTWFLDKSTEGPKQETVLVRHTPEVDDKEIVVRKLRSLQGAKAIADSLRNPDSMKMSSILYMPSGAICYEFRAQNGFGGMNFDYAVETPNGRIYINDAERAAAGMWKKYCANKSGQSMMADN
jgi:hypothetical protein